MTHSDKGESHIKTKQVVHLHITLKSSQLIVHSLRFSIKMLSGNCLEMLDGSQNC